MRILAHLVSIILLLPSLVFATAFVALSHVTSQPGFWAFILALLEVFVVFFPFALVALALLIALAIIGCSERHRWAAAICVGAIAIGSTGVLLWLSRSSTTQGDATFHLPAAVAVAIAVWLAVTEWPGARDEAPPLLSPPPPPPSDGTGIAPKP